MGGFRVVQACAIAYAGWQGAALESAAELEKYFWHVANRANEALDDQSAFDDFVAWFDGTPRHIVLPLLLSEVNRAIAMGTTQDAADDSGDLVPAAVTFERPRQATALERVPTRADLLV
jgi:hypothetical protein